MKLIFAVGALALFAMAASAAPVDQSVVDAFAAWRIKHQVRIPRDQYEHRFQVFAENHAMIQEHNAGNHGYTLGHNVFSTLTWAEFKARMGFKPLNLTKLGTEGRKVFDYNGQALPTSVDWTTKGAVTPVKDQGQCGSCWAFSTTGSLEGAYFLKNNQLVSFSEQQLVDCDTVDSGCNGGLMDNAFGWIKTNGGLCTEDDYSYTAATGTCQTSCKVVTGSSPSKFTDVAAKTDALAAAVAAAPVSVAIEADQSAFQFYSGGVMDGACGTNLDHGVLAVGYGTDAGKMYWKVKNSWGGSWGENGYIRMLKGSSQAGGQCGILTAASFPTL